jgi:hypothetical protein
MKVPQEGSVVETTNAATPDTPAQSVPQWIFRALVGRRAFEVAICVAASVAVQSVAYRSAYNPAACNEL